MVLASVFLVGCIESAPEAPGNNANNINNVNNVNNSNNSNNVNNVNNANNANNVNNSNNSNNANNSNNSNNSNTSNNSNNGCPVGQVLTYHDGDGDGFGAEDSGDCTDTAEGRVLVGMDCNDDEGSINPSAPEIRDALDNDCDEFVDCADANLLSSDMSCPITLFVSSTSFLPSAIRGPNGADAACKQEAMGNFDPDIVVKAVISSVAQPVNTRINISRDVASPSSQAIAGNGELFGTTLLTEPNERADGSLANVDRVWTGSDGEGNAADEAYCSAWVNPTPTGARGNYGNPNSPVQWLVSGNAGCFEAYPIYCITQPQ